MKVIGIIPARLNSTRMKRKMLAPIAGKPLVFHTWNQARKASRLDDVIVATDSDEIARALLPYGARVVMTSPKLATGTDRVQAASKLVGYAPDIVINIQGDEPMMPPSAINKTAELLLNDTRAVMSTVATPVTDTHELKSPSVVKVVLDKDGNALYFSRSLIPFPRSDEQVPVFKHLGLYGYRFDFLQKFSKLKTSPLEKRESLEQLRALEHGYRIKVGVGTYIRMEVNTPQEYRQVKRIIEGKMRSKRPSDTMRG